MRSIAGEMQLHALGGFTAEYEVRVSIERKYNLTARVAAVQIGQKIVVSTNHSGQPNPIVMPYTLGVWQPTEAVVLDLAQGKNTIRFELVAGSRGVTVKDFTLKAVN